ncbi:MAG: methyltransferase, partial [Halobacteriota archaeon]
VVDTGPYRYVRHPSYTGAPVIWIGLGLAFQSWGGSARACADIRDRLWIPDTRRRAGLNFAAWRSIYRALAEEKTAHSVSVLAGSGTCGGGEGGFAHALQVR